MAAKAVLDQFLNLPIDSSQGVFEVFAQLAGAIWKKGDKPLEQFIYIPGTREDRVVLSAHADTVWDAFYGNPQDAVLCYEDGVYSSGSDVCGIGTDDRAGCALVWALRNSGHSLLILDGEEKGKIGAKYLKEKHPRIFREINRHRFILELDWAGSCACLFNQVDNTKAFKDYIQKEAGFFDSRKKGGSDLQILCRDVCGANLSVGWQACHSPKERLVLVDWEKNFEVLSDFLVRPQPKFAIPVHLRIYRGIRAMIGKVLRKLGLRK